MAPKNQPTGLAGLAREVDETHLVKRGRKAAEESPVIKELRELLMTSKSTGKTVAIPWNALPVGDGGKKRAVELIRRTANRAQIGVSVRDVDGDDSMVAFKASDKRGYSVAQ
jgi:hypothetical protein